jgi:hypothetical protein
MAPAPPKRYPLIQSSALHYRFSLNCVGDILIAKDRCSQEERNVYSVILFFQSWKPVFFLAALPKASFCDKRLVRIILLKDGMAELDLQKA